MSLPKDPVMMLSVVNTELRDKYASLDELAASNMISKDEIVEKLASINYVYDETVNQFE